MLYIICVGIVLFGIACIVVYRRLPGSVHVDRYEYLDCLSLHTWKEGMQVLDEMEKKKGGRVSMVWFHEAMNELEEEGLVQSRLVDASTPEKQEARGFARVKEFKLNEGGRRSRLELPETGALNHRDLRLA